MTAAGRDVFRYVFHRLDEPPATPDEALAIIRARPELVDQPVGDPTEPPTAPRRAGGRIRTRARAGRRSGDRPRRLSTE